ncbi:FIST C-terminal domain-containing protein [Desulfovibrio sp. OttesenSCG-928-I05]|nr:FIST C-terminal domain-containing protein [Desulfovibrio sp. OttesenSCG-928-I05]
MLHCVSVFTYEIDDPERALKEIREQLEEKITFLEHSVGIILCHPEFIESGVVKHLSENLPFECVGMTTSSQAVNGGVGELILTLFVMTSSDVHFRTGVTADVDDGIDGPVHDAFTIASAGTTETPKLVITFPPLLLQYAGDAYIYAWEKVLPGVPVFGSIAIDDTLTFDTSETIYNGVNYKSAVSFVLCYGNINPRFLVGTLPEENVLPYKGEVTKATGPFVQEINNMNAYTYFESIGFANNGTLAESYLFMPFVIDQKKRDDYDGIPVVRGHVSFTDDGTAIFRGDVYEGSTFSLLTCTPEGVLSTTRQAIEHINTLPDINGVLIFPCIVRRLLTQRVHPVIELETAKDAIDPSIPFMAGYSGGEICPTSFKESGPANRFHNYSLVILIV